MESQLILQILFYDLTPLLRAIGKVMGEGDYMQSKIKSLLYNCYDDIGSIEFQLFLISVKCMIPYEDKIGCLFDIGRYEKEIDLFAHYMNSNDETVDYWLQHKKPSAINDGLVEFKILPIVLSNTIWENLIEEALKAVTVYTLNKNTILNAILISSATFEFMNNTELEEIEEFSKEKIINFSIKEFFTKNQILTDKNYIIDFEKERIKLITKPMLFDENDVNGFKSLNYIFGHNNGLATDKQYDIIGDYSAYLYKLRKGLIDPEKLKIPDKMPDIKECLNYTLFNHPLLGRCKVLQRKGNEAIVKNKSGLMRIRI